MKLKEELTNEAILHELGVRIRAQRVRARIKQEELAERCGVSRGTIVRLESGERATRLVTFLSALRQLNALHALDVVLPEDVISPLEMAELERHRKPLPRAVRTRRSSSPKTIRWGDEEV